MSDIRVPDGKRLALDPEARSAKPGIPAFIARPAAEPVYYGFSLVEETRTDGWCYGAITEYSDPDGCDVGDGFVEAPDGSRAGLVWAVGTFETSVIIPPEDERWGVYSIAFPRVIRDTADLTACFRAVLPELKRIREALG